MQKPNSAKNTLSCDACKLFVCESCITERGLDIPDVNFLFAASKDKVSEQKIMEMANFLVDVHISRITSAACPPNLNQEMWAYVWKLFNKINHTAQYELILQADRDNLSAASIALNDIDLQATQAADLKRFKDAQKAAITAHNALKGDAEKAAAKATKAYDTYIASEIKRKMPKSKAGGKVRKGAAAAAAAADSDDDSDDSSHRAKKSRPYLPALIVDEAEVAAKAAAAEAAAEARAAAAAAAEASRVSLDLTDD